MKFIPNLLEKITQNWLKLYKKQSINLYNVDKENEIRKAKKKSSRKNISDSWYWIGQSSLDATTGAAEIHLIAALKSSCSWFDNDS